MNRRKALWAGLVTGGLVPSALRAQEPGRARAGDGDLFPDFEPEPTQAPRSRRDVDPFPPEDSAKPGHGFATDPEPIAPQDDPPADLPDEPGYTWLNRDISRYTSLAYDARTPRPQNDIVNWIFRRTGSEVWHGEKIAVLSASRAQIRAYHSRTWLREVDAIVQRFIDATADILDVRVRFFAAQDPRWRYAVYSRLNRIGTGPHGQQIWTLTPESARLVESQLLVTPGFKALADRRFELVNGQTVTVETADKLDYFAGAQRESSVGLGYQPSVQNLNEGVTLRFSPLLNHEGDMLDAAVDLKAVTVKRLYRTRILARREIGPNDLAIDIPEVTETRLNLTVPNWPLGQTLLISGGITPGILQPKGGFLRLPGTMPTDTELLVFLDVEPQREPPRAARRTRDR
jgi:hypothetical protein